jgi:murein DD-endopeptidase MepM/ murein hydrolase activator NlpD
MEELQATLADLDRLTDQRVDLLTVMESRLFDQKIGKLMVPTQQPVAAGVGIGLWLAHRSVHRTFGAAYRAGFPGGAGTPILRRPVAWSVTGVPPGYGNMVEIDHGNDLITRYAHASRVHVKKGDLIKRGQKIAEVGTTGRSTGPHLHFEVLVQGVPQDPQKFLHGRPGGCRAGGPVAGCRRPLPPGPGAQRR